MNKKILSLILIALASLFLLLGCTNISQVEDDEYNEFLNDADLNLPLVDDKNNGNVFSNLDEFRRVRAGDSVSVHYTGTLLDGEKFDSSYDRGETLDFVAGAGQMIKGFDDAIIGMRVGEKKTIQIPPKEAYGDVDYLPLELFDLGEEELEVGMVFNDGFNEIVVVSVDGNVVGVLNNHPLAGQTLVFDIELVKIN